MMPPSLRICLNWESNIYFLEYILKLKYCGKWSETFNTHKTADCEEE